MGDLRILIADSHHICRRGLRTVLTAVPGWTVCSEAETSVDAIERTCALLPDAVVLSLNLSAPHALVAAQHIRADAPSVEIVLLAARASPRLVSESLRTGVRSLVLKSDSDDTLVAAIAAACRHQAYLSQSVAEYAMSQHMNEPLSPRECEVARLVALGRGNKEVAAMLGITAKTVETYRARIMRKVGAHSVVDLVHYAIDLGLIDIEASERPSHEPSPVGNSRAEIEVPLMDRARSPCYGGSFSRTIEMQDRNPATGGLPVSAGDVASVAERPATPPQTGDVVIVRTSDPESPFSIQQVPGGAQFYARTRKDAIQMAHGFAQSHAIDLSYSDQQTCSVLERHRTLTVTARDDQKG